MFLRLGDGGQTFETNERAAKRTANALSRSMRLITDETAIGIHFRNVVLIVKLRTCESASPHEIIHLTTG